MYLKKISTFKIDINSNNREIKKKIIQTNAEFTLQDFQSHQITAVITLHDNLGQHSVAAVFTLHDGPATRVSHCMTLQ